MRAVSITCLKIVWAAYFVLTSLYCLLTFLPYTYAALIKAPAYDWMPWFVRHHAVLYWMLLCLLAFSIWPYRKERLCRVVFAMLAAVGLVLVTRPVLPSLTSNSAAFAWAIIFLLPLLAVPALELSRVFRSNVSQTIASHFGYASATLAAIIAALLYAAGSQYREWNDPASLQVPSHSLHFTLWSILSHVVLAVGIVSILNLTSMAASRSAHSRRVRWLLVALLTMAAIWTALARFMANALSFEGWPAHLYAASLALALTSAILWIALPLVVASASAQRKLPPLAYAGIAIIFTIVALGLPSWVSGSDWNGILLNTFTLVFWIVLSVCLYRLRPERAKSLTVASVLVALVIAAAAYKGLQISAIFWSRTLGPTDDDIARALEDYAARDSSFQLAHHILGNARHQPCADLCRILREYTDIRDARVTFDVNLVEPLVPATGDRPNIFLLVIDSLRPDYLGAYNSKVDFTPSLDAFARDSIAIKNSFTQYAGTTLSEPAIWSGTMLLHSHYMQPFSRLNNLEKLARVNNYRTIVSYDTVLRELLSPSDDTIKLDTDKSLWNRFETCSTLQQTEKALAQAGSSRPILFYAQPMNVHQFARNNLPSKAETGWRQRTGFNNRVAYEVHQVDQCLGRFFSFLKGRGLYDSSIIIVTSDHGDATGELGRSSHSVTIYPEIMRVPMLVHLPAKMRNRVIHDDRRITLLTDITPTLYYLLGHRPIQPNPIFGIPMFVEDDKEWADYPRDEIFLASDVRAAYGLLAENGRYLYVTYDSPAQSHLWDLKDDPNARNDIVTPALKRKYDERIIDHLHRVADFYGYKPGLGSLLASQRR